MRPAIPTHGAAAPASPADVALESWLTELERLDSVLAQQAAYLDAIEHGEDVAPPRPFVGNPDLPQLPASLTPYARDLVERNRAVTERSMTLAAQLRPRHQRPLHVPTPMRGNRFERQA